MREMLENERRFVLIAANAQSTNALIVMRRFVERIMVKGLVTTGINVLYHESYQAVHEERVDKEPYKLPAYCHKCGEPFPWTQSAIAEASDLVEKEMPELNTDEKAEFKAALPKVISDTSLTTRAAKMISKLLKKVAPTANETFKQIFYRLVADGAKVLIWG